MYRERLDGLTKYLEANEGKGRFLKARKGFKVD